MAGLLARTLNRIFGVWDWPDTWDLEYLFDLSAGNGKDWNYTIPWDERWHLLHVNFKYQNSPASATVYLYLAAYRGDVRILWSPAKAGQAQGNTYEYNMGTGTMRFSVSAINNVMSDPIGDWWYLMPGDRLRIYAANQSAFDNITNITLYYRRWKERLIQQPRQE